MTAKRILRVGFVCVVLLSVSALSAPAATLTENFPDPLGGFYTRWLGANSNIGSFYYSAGNCDKDFRGSNFDALWISGNQVCGGGVGDSNLTITFDPTFGATLTSLKFDLKAFVKQDVTIYDMFGRRLASSTFSGDDLDFDHEDIISATSTTGIGKFIFDSSAYGREQISGNTFVDDFEATTATPIPEPASLLLLGAGLIGLALKRK